MIAFLLRCARSCSEPELPGYEHTLSVSFRADRTLAAVANAVLKQALREERFLLGMAPHTGGEGGREGGEPPPQEARPPAGLHACAWCVVHVQACDASDHTLWHCNRCTAALLSKQVVRSCTPAGGGEREAGRDGVCCGLWLLAGAVYVLEDGSTPPPQEEEAAPAPVGPHFRQLPIVRAVPDAASPWPQALPCVAGELRVDEMSCHRCSCMGPCGLVRATHPAPALLLGGRRRGGAGAL